VAERNVSLASIQTSLSRLQSLLAGGQTVAATMEGHGIRAIPIKYQAALIRAMQDLNRWTRSADAALTDEMQRRGLFQATGSK
jgi:hypothetical protein